jgi:hypothetical protein
LSCGLEAAITNECLIALGPVPEHFHDDAARMVADAVRALKQECLIQLRQ